MKLMQKGCFLLVVVLLFLTSCDSFKFWDVIPGETDPYIGLRPVDHPQTKWVCDEPEMWFEIVNGEDGADNKAVGKIFVDGEDIDITVHFQGHGSQAVFFYAEDEMILSGLCKYSEESVEITVDSQLDTLFKNKCDKIIFNKT